jgi:hypothetical protein
MKSGNLNFLEACGPLQACNGTDLLLIPATSGRRVTLVTIELGAVGSFDMLVNVYC